jgi:hypothetical protein
MSFQEYESCNCDVTCDVKTSEKIMNEHFKSDMSEARGRGKTKVNVGKVDLQEHSC